jgi:hypothetical protein
MKIDAEARDMLHRFLFIANLHRGSFLAMNWVASLFRRFASLPANFIKGASSFLTMENTLKLPFQLKDGMPTSIEGMSSRNPILLELTEAPIVPGGGGPFPHRHQG